MGGSIAITVREENGKEHRMCRWTNVLPWFINNIGLMNKNRQHVEEYVKLWKEMREDYVQHEREWMDIQRIHGNDAYKYHPFENDNTPCYADHPFLAPVGYGLIVIDMQKNHILGYQDYTSIGKIGSSCIRNDMNSDPDGSITLINIGFPAKPTQGIKAFYNADNANDAVRFRELFEGGRINGIETDQGKLLDMPKTTLENVVGLLNKGTYFNFIINMSPYKVINYGANDSNEAEKMRVKVRELGFHLTDGEDKLWDDWKEASEND